MSEKAHLKSIPGGKSGIGSKAWSEKMRKRAKEVSGGLETGYMELAEVLYNLFDVPVDGDPSQGPWFKVWGYTSIGDFAESELSLNRRKAEYLRAIWYRLEVELEEMDPETKTRIVNLGWSKVRELIKVLTLKNAKKWADVAENCNFSALLTSVQKYQEKLKSAQTAKAKGEKYVAPTPVKVEKNEDLPTSSFGGKGGGASGKSEAYEDNEHPPQEDDLDDIQAAPINEQTTSKMFSLFPDQLEMLKDALDRAKELTNSPKEGYNLSMICQDFLATNLFGKPGPDQVIRFLAKYEKLFNVRLVVIDQDDDPIYGVTNLEELANKLGVQSK